MRNKITVLILTLLTVALLSCAAQQTRTIPTTGLIVTDKPTVEAAAREEEPSVTYEPDYKAAEEDMSITEKPVEIVRDDNFYFKQGMEFDEKGMYRDALEAYQEAVNMNPDNIDAQYKLGMSLLRVGDKDTAFDIYKFLMERDRTIADAFYEDVLKATYLRSDNEFVMQVGAFRTTNNAYKLLDMLKLSFLNAFVEKEQGLDKVRILGIRSRAEGNVLKDEIYKKYGIKPFLIRAR